MKSQQNEIIKQSTSEQRENGTTGRMLPHTKQREQINSLQVQVSVIESKFEMDQSRKRTWR